MRPIEPTTRPSRPMTESTRSIPSIPHRPSHSRPSNTRLHRPIDVLDRPVSDLHPGHRVLALQSVARLVLPCQLMPWHKRRESSRVTLWTTRSSRNDSPRLGEASAPRRRSPERSTWAYVCCSVGSPARSVLGSTGCTPSAKRRTHRPTTFSASTTTPTRELHPGRGKPGSRLRRRRQMLAARSEVDRDRTHRLHRKPMMRVVRVDRGKHPSEIPRRRLKGFASGETGTISGG